MARRNLAHEERLHDRKPVTGWPGFGHRRDGDHWRLDPIEAPVLRQAIDDVPEGFPMAAVVKRWSEPQIPTRLGGQWTISTLKKVLTAPRLAGILVYSGREVGRTEYIEPIIEEPTLRRLQTKMAARKASRARLDRQLLTGILVCGKCSTLLNSTIKGSRTPARVYSCRNCGGVSINGEAVDNVMTDALFRALEEGGADAVRADGADSNAQVLAELAFLDEQEAALADAAADLPVSVLRAKGAAILKRRHELRKRPGSPRKCSMRTPGMTEPTRSELPGTATPPTRSGA